LHHDLKERGNYQPVNVSPENPDQPLNVPLDSPGAGAFLREPVRAPWILALVTFLFLAPFLNRAFNIDEPLFLWTAAQIQQHPLDPYGFPVNWYLTPKPMSVVTKNPPLAAYYLAGVAAVFGWSEAALHLAFLLPALGVVLGSYFLARSWCRHPMLAALTTLAAPVFLVSSATVMCDTMMLAFWVWAIFFWREGLERNRTGWLALAGGLIAAAALTKYFAISLIPLLAAYTIWKKRRWDSSLLLLLIPTLILALYDAAGRHLYGRSLVMDAGDYASSLGKLATLGSSGLGKSFIGLGFAGGGLMAPLLFLPLLRPSKRVLAVVAVLIVAGAFVVALMVRPEYATITHSISDPALILQWGAFGIAGLVVLWLAAADLWRSRDETSLLLALWVAGSFAFTCLVNWSVNGRSVLPLAPVAAILLVRRLDLMEERQRGGVPLHQLLAPLAGCAAIALAVTQADASLADSSRRAATQIAALKTNPSATLWFSGHWGFQYYLEKSGGKCVNFSEAKFAVDDLMAMPANNGNVFSPPEEAVVLVRALSLQANAWVTTQNPWTFAGFYSSQFGPLPFAWGAPPAELYQIVRFKISVSGTMN
jgi:4-amino-4-deoxy-L-arabinose transferase-like glycosyltransferase